ncbi:MAG: four helix bundle protein [Saprospiraceae bacterium]
MEFDPNEIFNEVASLAFAKEDRTEYERPNPLRDKSFAFAVTIGEIAMPLCEDRKTYYAGNQLLRSSSSVAANISEANGASSPKDFVAKLYIALKEARESNFWMRYAVELKLLKTDTTKQPIADLDEVVRILKAVIKTTKARHLSKPGSRAEGEKNIS